MKSTNMNMLLASTSALIAAASLWPAGPANAQAAPTASPPAQQAVEEIVVTGTQIRGVAPVGSQVISVGQIDIQQSGLLTTDDVIRSLPQISNLGANEVLSNSAAAQSTLNVTRAQGIDLRGLGPQATLVLVDGHRPAPEGVAAQLYDPSGIPTLALSRVEVVADGASAIYGADAVAGVVNLVLRKNFDGFEVSGSATTANGYSGYNEGAIFGKKWDGGSIMIAGEHQYHSNLATSARPNLYNSNETQYGGPNLNIYASVPGNLCTANCSITSTPTAGSYGLPGGTGVGLTQASLLSSLNRVNAFLNQSILPETDRVNFVAAFHQDLTPDLTIRAEGFHSLRHFASQVADLTKAVTVPSSNPFYVPIAGAPLCAASVGAPAGATCESVSYDFYRDLGPTHRDGYEENYLANGGFDYKLPHDFKLTADVVYGQNVEFNGAQALNSNAIATAVLNTSPATSLNVFGSGGNNNAATLASIAGYTTQLFTYKSILGAIHLDGPVFALPAGMVRIAIGAETHSDSLGGAQVSNTTTTSVALSTVTSGPSYDTRNVRLVYAEVLVPIVSSANAIPGIAKLDFDIAARYDDYSDFGPTTNPKFGINYSPVQDLVLTGSYGTSFRAATLSQKDPSSTAVAFYNNAAFLAACPGGYSASCGTVMLGGGNAAIKPETAKTYSFGATYRPKWLSGFDLNATFFHVDYINQIGNPGSLNPVAVTNPAYAFLLNKVNTTTAAGAAAVLKIINTPYYASATAFSPAALPTTVTIINGQQVNAGESVTEGVDFGANYRWRIADNQLNAGISGEYLTKYLYQLVPGTAFLDQLNTINNPLRFKARATVGWSLGGWRANAYLNYVNSYIDNATPSGANATVAAYETVDLTIAYNTGDLAGFMGLAKNINVSLSAQNLFDAVPPVALQSNYVYDSTVGNPIGRLVTLQVRKAF